MKPDNWAVMGSSNAYEGCKEFVVGSDLMLVDFGRAVDLTRLVEGGRDVMDLKLTGGGIVDESMMCVAMRKGHPWSFDADTYGICSSAYSLLFGKHIEITQGRNKRWKPRDSLKRYWQTELWNEFFDTLLNSDEGSSIGSRPRSLRSLRLKFESYLSTKQIPLDEALRAHARKMPLSREHIEDMFK